MDGEREIEETLREKMRADRKDSAGRFIDQTGGGNPILPELSFFFRGDHVAGKKAMEKVRRISSSDQARAYVIDREGEYDIYRKIQQDSPSFASRLMALDDQFFADHDLAVLLIETSSGSARPTFVGYSPVGDDLRILVKINGPGPGEFGTADMAAWHGMIRIPKNSGKLVLKIY